MKKTLVNTGESSHNKETSRNAADNSATALTNPASEEQGMADEDSTPGKSPAFQFYPSDFINGTLTLTTEDVGAYMLLLCHCWDKGFIPSDMALLSRITRMTPAKMRRVWASISGKFVAQGDVYIQTRLERERAKQNEYRRRQSDRAAKRWQSHGNATASPRHPPGISRDDALPSSNFNLQSSDFSQKTPVVADARSKRPIFKGQRLTVFEWMFDDLRRMLGKHTEDFDLHAWFYTLDAQAVASDVLIPQRDGGKWLQERTMEEAMRRGLPLAVTGSHNPKTAGNLAAAARFVARGQR